MLETKNIPLVLSEITALWNEYMGDSSAICTFKYFLRNVEDSDIREILQYALDLSEKHVQFKKQLMEQENISIPVGFNEADVNIDAPRLFTDAYYLYYLNNISSFGMEGYALILRYVTRPDIREYFSRCLVDSKDLYNRVVDIQLSKGLLERVPREEVEKMPIFPKDESILKGSLIGDPRPMFAREVTNTFSGIQMDLILKAAAVGFSQVAKSQSVKEYMQKGKDMFLRHYKGFASHLTRENLPAPSTHESFVTDSTLAPFSDKLMMYLMLQLCNFGLIVDGSSFYFSLRSDLTALHVRYGAELAKYSRNGMVLMINNGWFEQPPQIIKHENLSHQ
ncbi:hypothetical protein HMPREF1982_01318 [Clostridiales bacterium oral taxon 876 str. F0540]|nr:hypothetical protein HMPREF1982_01318 [Clostridiales bacterium oral taxon 876 str. F0540]